MNVDVAKVLWQYRAAVIFYTVATLLLTTLALDDGPRGTEQRPGPRPTLSASATPPQVPTSPPPTTPQPPQPTLPVSPPPPQQPPPNPPPSPAVPPPPTTSEPPPGTPAQPRNKARGLKDGCLVQHKKWLIRQPC